MVDMDGDRKLHGNAHLVVHPQQNDTYCGDFARSDEQQKKITISWVHVIRIFFDIIILLLLLSVVSPVENTT